MEVIEKEMFHFHKIGIKDLNWNIGNTIEIDQNFESNYSNIFRNFNTNVKTNEGYETIDRIIDYYIKKDLDSEQLIKLLKDARDIIYLTNIFKREIALEIVRQTKYKNLPSRRKSIWVTDREGIDFWRQSLSKRGDGSDLKLYKLSLTGSIFMTSDYYIPNDDYLFEQCLRTAENYWNPDFNRIKNDRNEYLFQGKAKILEKIQ